MSFILIYLEYTSILSRTDSGTDGSTSTTYTKSTLFSGLFLPDFGCFYYSIPKVEKVGKSQKSRKLRKSTKSQESLDLLRVGKVGKLLESRRVGQVSLLNVLCIVLRVGIGVRCYHMLLLVGVTKVVFTEEDT